MQIWKGSLKGMRIDKAAGLLTMCRRAGKLAMGFDAAKEAILKGRAELILLSSDISSKTEKEVRFYSDKKNVPIIKTDSSMEELEYHIGKKVGILAVCDKGFAGKTKELCSADADPS